MKDFDFDLLKQMAKRFNPLPTGDQFLDTRYDWQMNENNSEWPYYRFLYHLTSMLRPALSVELGGFQGTAAVHMASGWKNGTVITIDHHSDTGDEFNRTKMLECCTEERANLIYYQGWTTQQTADKNKGKHALGDRGSVYDKVVTHVNHYNKKIDILFIDAWHHYEYAMLDWEAYRPLLNSPALVLCDDIIDGVNPLDPICGMIEFWNQMPEPKFLNSNLHPQSNLGFVKV